MSRIRPAKRSPSPLSSHLDGYLKGINIGNPRKKSKTATPSSPESVSVQRGQEILSLHPSLQHDLGREKLNDLILETTLRLAKEGKRLLRAPRLQ